VLLVAARRRGRLGRLVGGDASSYLPRNTTGAIQVVSVPAVAAGGSGPPMSRVASAPAR